MEDCIGASVKYYRLGFCQLQASAKECSRNGHGTCEKPCVDKAGALGADSIEAHELSQKCQLVVDNSYFMAWLPRKGRNIVIWCLSPRGGVLKVADNVNQPFKFSVRSQNDAIVGLLRSVDGVGLQRFCGAGIGEPKVVTTFRKVLKTGFTEGAFTSPDECICEYWDAMNAALDTSVEEYAHGMACRDLGQGIYHVQFAHQLLMASTMLRLQERYECPCEELRGRSFELAEYKAWERRNDPLHGFRYYCKWPGFNVPGSVVWATFQEAVLSPREKALKHVLGSALSLPTFYVIGTKSGDEAGALLHEVCHAMYEVNAGYRADVDNELASIPAGLMYRMKMILQSMQYPNVERILQDEVHAYLCEGDPVGCRRHKVASHTKRLRAIFSEHAGDLSNFLHVQEDTLLIDSGSGSD